jgi:outer membrane receptor for ferrienterochelin and colicins
MKGYNPMMQCLKRGIYALQINLILVCMYAIAQGTVVGIVLDRDTQQPLPGANVFLQGTVIGAVTDNDGNFRIRNVPPEPVVLIVTMIGYERFVRPDIRVTANETLNLTVELRPTVIETSPVVVTATKTERSLRDVPTSVSVMRAQDIERRNVFTIDEVLRKIPGVHFNLSQINIRGSSGYSHGAGTRVLLLVDGVPMLSGDSGEITWELIPVDQVERVEVVKGAGSSLYGSSALGGVVNIITRDVPERSASAIRMQGGIYGEPYYEGWRWSDRSRFNHHLQITHGRRFGDLRITGSLGTLYDDGYRQNDSRSRITGYLKAGYTITPYREVTVSALFIDQSRKNFLYWRSFDHALEPFEEQIGEEVESFRIQSNVQYRHVFGSESFLTARASWYHSDWHDNIGILGNASRSDVYGTEVQFNHALAGGHFLVSGIDASYQTVDSDLFGTRGGYVLATYAQNEWNVVEPLRLTWGIRFDVTQLDTVDSFMNISPRAGVVYNLLPRVSFRISAGTGFRAPAVAEAFANTAASNLIVRPNPDLKAERSRSFEGGVNADVAGWINVDAAYFYNQYFDMIEPVVTSIEPTGEINAQFVNVVRARVHGTEVGATLYLFDRRIQPRFAYTLVDSRDLDRDEPLKYRHKHMITTGLLGRYGIGWVEVDYRYLSKVENIDDELGIIVDRPDEQVPVHVVDVSGGLEGSFMGIPMRFSVSIKNLLQYHYVEFVANVQPIRQYIASLHVAI